MKMGILEVLTVIFVVLKLTNLIDWSWLVVLSPGIFGILFGLMLGLILEKLKAIAAKSK